jgi:NADP-dependent 3-hydroxy acid dehydrogenase YdfG
LLKVFLSAMSSFFHQKTVLITGASSGIGKALTLDLLSKGARVAICARDKQKLNQFAQAVNNPNLLAIQADVSSEEDCKNFVNAAVNQFGNIHILINNAGISMRALYSKK